ncbi:MAG: M18 family aminopeptidase [Myxococcota bacterium]
MTDPVADLLSFLDRSPTPYHAVAECVARLERAGFRALDAGARWKLDAGDKRYCVRGDGSLVAFEIGQAPVADAGFRWIGAHTDSPNLRVKPLPDASAHGYQRVAVETYGGVLLHTWLDRDLSLAGRVTLRGANGPTTVLVDFARPLLRVPNLAIHLYREIRTDGLKLNAQTHGIPVLGLEDAPALPELLLQELRAQDLAPKSVAASDLLGFDLMAYDTQPACVSGARGEFVQAARLDNLASCHSAVSALLDAGAAGPSRVHRGFVLYDHEEVGSRSAQGAGGPLLAETLERIAGGTKDAAPDSLARALTRSVLVSADMAHALHPNYADRHEPGHQPRIGAGPVIKINANQSYASDAVTGGLFADLCQQAGLEPQYFVARNDMGCGSTIGPISAARVGMPTVDVGNPMLSMHSCREMAGSADVAPMIDVLTRFLAPGDG